MTNDSALDEHRANAPAALNIAVLTVSDTRTLETDSSGTLIVESLAANGHRVSERDLVPDEPECLRAAIDRFRRHADLHAILITGGTGVSPRDRTFEAVSSLLTTPLPGFGELFRMLSYAEIGSACILSRAFGGLIDKTVVLAMPGSRAAVRLAMEKIILPELRHLVREALKS